MLKRMLYVLLVMVIGFLSCGNSYAEGIYCFDTFNQYRQIRYWAKISVGILDYDFDSGDCEALELVDVSKGSAISEPINDIKNHFASEFNRLIKGSLPFHDTDVGQKARWKTLYKKFHNDPNMLEKIEASEEARRTALYGANPAALYCNIRVSRREFPVLYQIGCSVIASQNLWNRGGLESEQIGYSTPEHIQAEIKRAITKQLMELSTLLKKVRECPVKRK